MHPSLRGHIALASAILESLRERGSWGWPHDVPAPVIDAGRCATHFGLDTSGWLGFCGGRQKFYWAAGNLRYDPSECRARERAYKEAVRRISAGEAPESLGLPNVGIPEKLPGPTVERPVPGVPVAPSRPVS